MFGYQKSKFCRKNNKLRKMKYERKTENGGVTNQRCNKVDYRQQ